MRLSQNTIRHILSGLMTLVLLKYYNMLGRAGYLPLVFLLMYSFPHLLKKVKWNNQRVNVSSLLFGVLWTLSDILGSKVDWENQLFYEWRKSDSIKLVLVSFTVTVIVHAILDYLLDNSEKLLIYEKKESGKKLWLIISGLIFVCWLPYLLSYFPANLSFDSFSSISQAMGIEKVSNAHPIMYTMFVKLCMIVGKPLVESGWLVLFSFCQMIIMALIMGNCISWFLEKKVPKIVIIMSGIFFCFSPVIALYSFTMWKDILFSGYVLLLSMQIFDIVYYNDILLQKKTVFKLCILSILVAFGRNNGIYVVVVSMLVVLVCQKRYWKRFTPIFLLLISVIVVIQGPIYRMGGIEHGNFAESLGVPLQQIGYTIKTNGEIAEGEEDFLENILPLDIWEELYRMEGVNWVKLHKEFNHEFLNNNKIEFIECWAKILPSNFEKYVVSYLIHTMGFWNADTTGYTYVFGIDSNTLGLKDENCIQKVIGLDTRKLIQNITEYSKMIPGINLFFCPAGAVWMLFFCFIVLSLKRRTKYCVGLVPLLTVWATIMVATPVSGEFRYVFCLHLAIPFIISLMFIKNEGIIGKEDS